jgi:hypothetical protein
MVKGPDHSLALINAIKEVAYSMEEYVDCWINVEDWI